LFAKFHSKQYYQLNEKYLRGTSSYFCDLTVFQTSFLIGVHLLLFFPHKDGRTIDLLWVHQINYFAIFARIKKNELLSRELLERWSNHKIMTSTSQMFFIYLIMYTITKVGDIFLLKNQLLILLFLYPSIPLCTVIMFCSLVEGNWADMCRSHI
jgi:hypothetical protein